MSKNEFAISSCARCFKNDNNVLILSHTVNPSNDTVEVLNGYAQTYGAIKIKMAFTYRK